MSRNKELAKNTIIIMFGKMCTQFMSFFLLPLYTSLLSTKDYGAVDLISTYIQLLIPIIFLQIEQAFFRYLIDSRNDNCDKEEIISTTVFFALIQSVILIIVYIFISSFLNLDYKIFLLINMLTTISSAVMLQSARGLGDNVGYSIASFITALVNILANIVLIVGFKLGAFGMFLASAISNITCSVFLFYKNRIYMYIKMRKFKMITLKKMLKYSIPLIPNALSWWAINAADRIIVSTMLGTAFNGILSISHKFSTIYMTFYNLFNLSWTETVSLHLNDRDSKRFISDVINTMFNLFMCIAIGIIAILPFIFNIMINEKFSQAYYQIPIFMLASMLNVVVGLYSVIYVALKNTKEIAKTSILAGIINIIVNLSLINKIGLFASSISTVISFGVMAIYRYNHLKKYINVKINKSIITSISILYVVTTISYYSKNTLLQLISLFIVIVYSIVLNKKILLEGIMSIKKFMKGKEV